MIKCEQPSNWIITCSYHWLDKTFDGHIYKKKKNNFILNQTIYNSDEINLVLKPSAIHSWTNMLHIYCTCVYVCLSHRVA